MSPDANERTAIDIAEMRSLANFDVTAVKMELRGGEMEWRKRRNIVDIISADSVFDKSQRPFMSRLERYQRAMAMANRIEELREQLKWDEREVDIAYSLCDEPVPLDLHTVAFAPVLSSQASADFLKEYGSLIRYRGVIGAYAQTELGHGSNLLSLETTATFMPKAQEFEIHSPTLTSTKWWIGALGRTATHAVVQAKLLLPSGQDMGPHLFFVQLRSLEDHKPMPGITMGDIGPKTHGGYAATDNGFVRFNRVRIPRSAMLSKFANVTEDGQYVKPPHAKLSYGGMLYIRSIMVSSAGWTLAKAITIAIRYTSVRRQGGPPGQEPQVIKYQSVYYRLLPILARAYVFIFLGRRMHTLFQSMSSRLSSGDTSLLTETHAVTAALKVLTSSSATESIEIARRAMGGHGYSAFAGIGRLYADQLPSTTYEGDNFVLDKQVVRSALKSLRTLRESSSRDSSNLSPSSEYLQCLESSTPLASSWYNPARSISLLQRRAAFLIQNLADNNSEDAGVNQRASKAIAEAFVAARVGEILEGFRRMGIRERDVLRKLFLLYLVITVEDGLADILSFDLLPRDPKTRIRSDPTASLRAIINRLCLELLPNSIGLSDAFGFTDWELDSALGVSDGKVYEALWERAQLEPLNKETVVEGYTEHIKPILQRGQRLSKIQGKL
ncbi:acyl-CoA oxidase [Sistotremastrum suecicum HHB10207 ss-3]|uniref:Acyl-coenzyme A oxidase n=1 Tax=Sistotremastrum suecicum HHB10207 ss-3 TaxID=1314776 RepID=A0A166EGC1_9AGAM|nr:acyl-CoA oxidase [Sistotremastrum suecicum HHB10207 ss-3]